MRMKIFIVPLLLLLIISFCACGEDKKIPDGAEPYYGYAELAMELPTEYTKLDSDSFDAFFSTGEASIGISRLSFAGVENDDLNGAMFPDDVARKYVEKNGLTVEIIDLDEYSYFIYNEGGYFNIIAFYRSKYAHFIVRFLCIEEKTERFKTDFLSYADNVYFIQ